MDSRFLAFRMFGDFERSVTPQAAPIEPLNASNTQSGAVEIWFAQSGDYGAWIPYLRWVPLSKFVKTSADTRAYDWVDFTGGLPTRSVYDLDDSALSRPEYDGNHIYALCATSKNATGVRLRYCGGAFFEQFSFGRGGGVQKVCARLPIVATDARGVPLSGLEIGQPKNPGIRVQLGVPTSLPLGKRWSRESRSGVLAFAVVFSRAPAGNFLQLPDAELRDGQPLRFDTLVAGAPGETLLAESGDDAEIGRFLFSRANVTPAHYRSFASKDTKSTVETSGQAAAGWDSLWLPAKGTEDEAIKTLLQRLGLRTSATTRAKLSVDKGFDATRNLVPTSAGLWIDPTENNEAPPFRVLNRLTLRVKADGSAVPAHDDDLRVKDGAIWLRLGGAEEGWSSVGSRLTVMADVSGEVLQILKYEDSGATQAARGFADPPKLDLRTSLAWSAAPSAMPGIDGIDRLFQAVIDGLTLTEGARLASVLAKVTVKSADKSRHPFAIEHRSEATAIRDGRPASDFGLPEGVGLRCYSGGMLCPTLTPAGPSEEPGVAKAAGTAVERALTLSFPLFDRATQPAKIDVDLVRDPKPPEGVAFSIGFEASRSAETLKLASIGGLVFADVALEPKPSSGERAATSSIALRSLDAPGYGGSLVFTVRFSLLGIAAVSPDVSQGPVPALLEESAPHTFAGTDKRPYSLFATESMGMRTERRLRAELREFVEGSSATTKFTLISFEPFATKRVISQRLDALGDDARSTVAIYSSLDGAWRTRASDNVYRYILPPQSIGEGMDKPRQLELHDASENDDWTSPIPASPEDRAAFQSGLRRRAVDFRLTPPADLWVRPSDVSRAFVLPEWAADALFVQKGEFGIGVALTGLRAEFVYGLSVAIDPTKASGPARRARVAEIGALVGRPLDTKGDERAGAGDTLDGRWAALNATIRTRPERLEIWADDPDSTTPFAPARFAKGAHFALRHTALHRNPVTNAPATAGSRSPASVEQAAPGQPRFHPHGLPGGALWPIESSNVLNMVAEAPIASGGSIEKIALSPLGGDADQTARFANNRVAIITETRGGYVQRQQIEVIGRIAVLWHRAKHVVVYERTVNPSAQFAPEVGGKTRTRRPVLRKVQEYVEILQPERRYPDMGGAAPASNSFLSGVRFNSRIIPVDSAWAEDVPDGFLVPLWNRHAARQRPQVYRKPDVAFLLHAEGAGDAPEAAQECLNPENLYFFADTSKGQTDDTDRWPQRLGLDGSTLPPPSARGLSGDIDRETTDVGLTPRGYERFTWRLAPPTARAKINAGRADTGVYAALNSVTFARTGKLDDTNAERAKTARDFKIDWDVKEIKTGISGVWKRGQPVEGAGEFPALSKALARAIQATPPTRPETEVGKTAFKDALSALVEAIPDEGGSGNPLVGLLEERGTKITDAFKKFADIHPDQLEKACAGIAGGLKAKIDARKLVLRQEFASWGADADRKLEKADAETITGLVARFGSEDGLKEYLRGEITAFVRPALDGATVEIGMLRRGIETARATVADAKAAVEVVLERLRTDLLATRRAIEDGKPWSEDRIGRFRAQIDDAFEKARLRVREALADARRRLATELDGLSQSVAGATAQALAFLEGIANDIGAAREDLSAWHGRIEARWTAAKTTVGDATFVAKLNDLEKKIRKVPNKSKLAGVAGRLAVLVENIRTLTSADKVDAVDKALADLKAFGLETTAKAQDAVSQAGEIVAATGAGIDAAVAELSTLADEANETVKVELTAAVITVKADVDKAFDKTVGRALTTFAETGRWIDGMVGEGFARIEGAATALRDAIDGAFERVDEAAAHVLEQVGEAEKALQPDALAGIIINALLKIKAVETAVNSAAATVNAAASEVDDQRDALRKALGTVVDEIETAIDGIGAAVATELGAVSDTCGKVAKGIVGVIDDVKGIAKEARRTLLEEIIRTDLDEILGTKERYEEFFKAFQDFDYDMRRVGNDLAASVERAEAWGDRAIGAIGDIGRGGIASAPNNILKALAAIGSGPELPNLDFARDRIGYYYGLAQDMVDTTPVEAWFGKLGGSLKAMGISLPFDKIGERLLPGDLSNFDIGRILGNFAGIDLSRLFKGIKMPAGAGEALRLTHDFDRKTFRAWARIDIDISKPGNASLFSIGPFTMDMVDARLQGFLRMSASKDTDKVEEAGEASIATDLAAIVGGQTMVTLRKVTLRYGKGGGLNVEFDPANIKLNPSLEFVQKTLKDIVPDEVGGMEVVKNDGIPVGLRHVFQLPPLSLMAGTSGVQNIQISNRFELLAFPDFVIANRFSLARPELPFIFSLFIVGGTGYLTVDVEYRPFEKQSGLLVIVEAGAGGSASLGFAFAGCTGSVFITVSLAITYRKMIGQSGGGLTVSMVVVICGLVDVLRIASAVITVVLRLSYRDNGDIDASGSFRITIRISRFFKISAGGQARYKMSGGKKESSSSSYEGYEVTDKNLKKAAKALGVNDK